jgi:hypothetical protein
MSAHWIFINSSAYRRFIERSRENRWLFWGATAGVLAVGVGAAQLTMGLTNPNMEEEGARDRKDELSKLPMHAQVQARKRMRARKQSAARVGGMHEAGAACCLQAGERAACRWPACTRSRTSPASARGAEGGCNLQPQQPPPTGNVPEAPAWILHRLPHHIGCLTQPRLFAHNLAVRTPCRLPGGGAS